MKRNKQTLPHGIYGITAEKFSLGRSNIDVVADMIQGGISVLQYREKENKTAREKLKECLAIRKMTRQAGVLFIVNDEVDIALLSDADGVHIGQDDLPIEEVRKLIGDRIIGLSTHNSRQAQDAILSGADYIGVGPLFATQTKDNVCEPVGLDYLNYVVNHVDIPFVAIGGIKQHNLNSVLNVGAKTVCLVTEIVGSDNISKTVKDINRMITEFQSK